jgi:hypothetical protein
MHIKFRITLEDGSIIESHDEMWNEVRAHSHALAPFNDKKWTRYELLSDAGHRVGVDFMTGEFYINGGVISPPWDGMEGPSTVDSKEFIVTDAWAINSSLKYFPIVGRRVYSGNYGSVPVIFCGWKTHIGNEVLEKKIGMLQNGTVIFVE